MTYQNKFSFIYCKANFDTTLDKALFSDINFLFSDFSFGVRQVPHYYHPPFEWGIPALRGLSTINH